MATLTKLDLKRMSKNELIRIVIDLNQRLTDIIHNEPDKNLLSINEVEKVAELAYKRGAADTLEAVDNQIKMQIAEMEKEQPHD